jgi:hypothetical protein
MMGLALDDNDPGRRFRRHTVLPVSLPPQTTSATLQASTHPS